MHEKMVNIFSQQRNGNQKYIEILPNHEILHGCHEENNEKRWQEYLGKRNSYPLLVEM
jgi:hypothetical protein